jgi:NAD+ kinase
VKATTRLNPVGIVTKPRVPRALPVLKRVTALLRRRKIRYLPDPVTSHLLSEGRKYGDLAALARRAKLLLVLGGDGTLLGVARGIGAAPVPVMGVNLGKLGFLTETALEEIEGVLTNVLAGRFEVEERMMLQVDVVRAGKTLVSSRVLNDVVINKSALARILQLDLRIDGQFVAVYHADGLIVATPTGSTAYSLSAGGPIVHPAMKAFCITPICPHALTNRPLVVPSTVTIQVTLQSDSPDVYCTLDGQVGLPLKAGDRLRVRRSPSGLRLVVPYPRNYFDVLRRKLRWGAR